MDSQDPNPDAAGFLRDRLPDGTFGPRNSFAAVAGRIGGRATAAKDEWRVMFDKVAKGVVTEARLRNVVEVVLKAAEAGDLAAAELLMNRLLGKPTLEVSAHVEHAASAADPGTIEMLQRIASRHWARIDAARSGTEQA